MYWVNFLHIYQPADQTKEILERVVNESYRPLFKGLLQLKNIKINLNINGALTETLAQQGYKDVLDNIKRLFQTKRLQFTESAKYHPLLPFLSEKEALRQTKKNHETNKKYFSESYKPACFFPPEMAYNEKVGKIASQTSCRAIILDEISYNKGKTTPPKNVFFTVRGLKIFFRERNISNCIMSAMIRDEKAFQDLIRNEKKEYICTAMDGETFGHHRPGLEKVLFKILETKHPEQVFFSDVLEIFPTGKEIKPHACTWASTMQDIEKGVQFYSWKDPNNGVHQLQWQLLNYLAREAGKRKISAVLQDKLDRAMASDQFFWASGEPWWSIEMIEKGAWSMLRVFLKLPGLSKKEKEIAQDLYKEIISAAFWRQRSGRIQNLAKKYKEAVKIPFKERTLEQGKPEVFYAFLKKMEEKMKEEAGKKNFERAILWRDAIWKLETKNDIYDAIHAVDLLRLEVPDFELKDLMDKYKKQYEKIKPGQPEARKA